VPIVAILDTSALYSPRQRAELQRLASEGAFIGVWSPWIIAELTRVLTWDWIRKNANDTSDAEHRRCSQSCKKMMAILLPTFQLINPLPPFPIPWDRLTDVWDVPIWAAAVKAGAHYVVSENTHHFPPRDGAGKYRHGGVEYIHPKHFLGIFRDEDEDTNGA